MYNILSTNVHILQQKNNNPMPMRSRFMNEINSCSCKSRRISRTPVASVHMYSYTNINLYMYLTVEFKFLLRVYGGARDRYAVVYITITRGKNSAVLLFFYFRAFFSFFFSFFFSDDRLKTWVDFEFIRCSEHNIRKGPETGRETTFVSTYTQYTQRGKRVDKRVCLYGTECSLRVHRWREDGSFD